MDDRRHAPVWHPLLAAVEQQPGLWHMTSQTGIYAVVRLIRIGDETGYRATTFDEPRRLLGYRRTLRSACELAHRAWVRGHGPDPGADQYPVFLVRKEGLEPSRRSTGT